MAVGCNYCFWATNFQTRPERRPEERFALTRAVGNIQLELTCMYSLGQGGRCREEVEAVREDLLVSSQREGGQDSQYVNTPSCQDPHWHRRYFGQQNYEKLLGLKAAWDPANIFNYCQSVGSTNHSCCG